MFFSPFCARAWSIVYIFIKTRLCNPSCSVVYWVTHLPNKQKILSLIPGRNTNPAGVASGRAFGVKICQATRMRKPLVNKGAVECRLWINIHINLIINQKQRGLQAVSWCEIAFCNFPTVLYNCIVIRFMFGLCGISTVCCFSSQYC